MLDGLNRVRRPLEGCFRQVGRMRIARGFPGHTAQAEALTRIKACGLQPPVIESQRFGLGVFEKQLAIIGARQRVRHDPGQPVGVQPGAGKKEIIGRRRIGHGTVFRV